MNVQSYYPVLCVDAPQQAARFYIDHFGFRAVFDADWYVHLQMEGNEQVNLAFVAQDHASLPQPYRRPAAGMLLNFELDEVDTLYHQLKAKGLPIVHDLKSEAWGQRHFIVADPCGILVDVVQPIEPSEEFKAQYLQGQAE